MRLLGREYSDRVLVLPAVVMAVLFVVFGRRMFDQVRSSYVFILMYLVFAAGGLLVYWRVQNSPRSVMSEVSIRTSPVERLALEVGFFLAFTAAIVALELHSPGAVRPPSYYAFTSIAVGMLTLRSLATTGETRDVLRVLAQILLLGVLIRFAFVYLNPYIWVSDPQFHWEIVQLTIAEGKFAGMGPYRFYPIFHLYNSVVFLLGSGTAAPAWLFPVVNSLIVTATLVVIFLLGRQLYDDRVGLLAAILTLIGNYYFLKVQFKVNWIAITFMLTALLVLFKLAAESRPNVGLWALFWPLTIVMLLIHPVGFAVFILVLAGAYVAFRILRGEINVSVESPVFSVAILFIAYILYIHYGLFADLVRATIGIDRAVGIQRLGLTANLADVPVLSQYTGELIINFVGAAGFMLIFVPGLLYCLREKNPLQNSFALGIGLIYIFITAAVLSGRAGQLSITRLLLYIAAFLGIGGAIGFQHMDFSSWKAKTIVLLFVVFISFFSMVSYTSNNFNGMYTDDIEHFQYSVKPSTLAAHGFLERTPTRSTIASTRFTKEYIAAQNPKRGMLTLPNTTVRDIYEPNRTESDFIIVNQAELSALNSQLRPEYGAIPSQVEAVHSKVYANTEFGIYYTT